MSSTTTNFAIPYPDVADSHAQAITAISNGTILIDQILASIQAVVGTGPGPGLRIVAGQLTVSYGFGLSINTLTDALQVDTAQLLADPLFSSIKNNFRVYYGGANVAISDITGVNSTLSFSSSYHPNYKKIRIADNGSNKTLMVSLVEVSSINSSNKLLRFVATSETQHNSSSFINSPMEWTNINTNGVLDYKVFYSNNARQKFVLGILYDTGSVSFYTIDANNITTAPVLLPLVITTQPDPLFWDVAMDPNTDKFSVVYAPTLSTPTGVAWDLGTSSATATFLLGTPVNDIINISVACSTSTSVFTCFYVEAGAPENLHAVPYIVAPVLVIVDAVQNQSLTGKIIAVGDTNRCFAACISLATDQVFIFVKDNTNANNIHTEAIITAHPTDILWGFVISGGTLAVTYRPLEAIVNYSMVYSLVVPQVVFVVTQNISTSNNINSSNIDLNHLFPEIINSVSNFIYSSIVSPNSGMVFYYLDTEYINGRMPIRRDLITLGGAQIEDELPMRWKMAIDVFAINNPNAIMRINFPVGNIQYDIINIINKELCYIEFQNSELVVSTPTIFNRDITVSSATTGVVFDSFNTYVHNPNRVILFFRYDEFTESVPSINDVRVFLGNGEVVGSRHLYEADPNQWSGLGLTGSGSSQRIDIGPYLSFTNDGKLTVIVAKPGNDTSSFTLLDNSALTYNTIGLAGLSTDLVSVYREAILGSLLTIPPVSDPIVITLRIIGSPSTIKIANIFIGESLNPTITVPPLPNNLDAVNSLNTATIIPVKIASVSTFGGDTLLVSEPINIIFNPSKVYVLQYNVQRPTTGTAYSTYKNAIDPGYRALAGGSALTFDADWSTPVDTLYTLYPIPFGGPPHLALNGFSNYSLGIIHKIETQGHTSSKFQGVIVSDVNGNIVAQHNVLSGLQGGTANPSVGGPSSEFYHLTAEQYNNTVATLLGGIDIPYGALPVQVDASGLHHHDALYTKDHRQLTHVDFSLTSTGTPTANATHLSTAQADSTVRFLLGSEGAPFGNPASPVDASVYHHHDVRYPFPLSGSSNSQTLSVAATSQGVFTVTTSTASIPSNRRTALLNVYVSPSASGVSIINILGGTGVSGGPTFYYSEVIGMYNTAFPVVLDVSSTSFDIQVIIYNSTGAPIATTVFVDVMLII